MNKALGTLGWAPAGLLVAILGCGGSEDAVSVGLPAGAQPLQIEMALRYGNQSVACGDVMEDVGLSGSTVELRDARMFVHDLSVELDSGATAAFELVPSEWQRDGVALLDFADDSGLCATGSPATNRRLDGFFEGEGEVVGFRFRVGLPQELNHLDSARAAAPLNAPGMAWSWVGGYKYARFDAKSSENEDWFIHLGATGCEGAPPDGITCNYSNIAAINVQGLDPAAPMVALDLERVYAGSDLDAPLDEENDSVSGCMAFSGDPECAPIFEAFGMGFEDQADLTATCFRAVGAP